jgi:16S rRNA (uracil1498-N3)-methyltransferase
MHRCYAPDVGDAPVTLRDDEAHHVRHVLRLSPGAAVVVFDGRGGEWDGRIVEVGRHGVTVGALTARAPAPEPPVAVTLAVGLLKGDQMSTVVRDATALGVRAIVPIRSAHTARPAGRRDEIGRLARIAVASSKQCGRAVVPAIEPVVDLPQLLARPAALRVCCVEPAHASGAAVPGGLPRVPDAIVCVGPEGGWAAEELVGLEAAGAHWLTLGPRTLRAEVAPVVALATLWTLWGWR